MGPASRGTPGTGWGGGTGGRGRRHGLITARSWAGATRGAGLAPGQQSFSWAR